MNTDQRSADVRLDKWLWAARFFKTRALAAQAIDRGRVRLNGERVKRAKMLRIGDALRIRLGLYEHEVRVLALNEHRGPGSEAARLYRETEASRQARDALATRLKAMPATLFPEGPRPTKRDRRRIDRFRRREP